MRGCSRISYLLIYFSLGTGAGREQGPSKCCPTQQRKKKFPALLPLEPYLTCPCIIVLEPCLTYPCSRIIELQFLLKKYAHWVEEDHIYEENWIELDLITASKWHRNNIYKNALKYLIRKHLYFKIFLDLYLACM